MASSIAAEPLDHTVALLIEGYDFISERCRRHRRDVFSTRLLMQKTLCVRGKEAAELFYDDEKFRRKGAAPLRLQKTLFGRGGIQSQDGAEHKQRKALFLSIVAPERVQELSRIVEAECHAALNGWEKKRRVVLFDALEEVLCRAVCAWAGAPLQESEVALRTADFHHMIDGAGGIGPRHWRARKARARADAWMSKIVAKVRAQRLPCPEGSALHAIATYRDAKGKLLRPKIAAVEVLNVLRPTVAVARFAVFAALALHEHPQCRDKLRRGGDAYLELFVQEVRRYYPFFPFVAAKVRKSFEWQGQKFPKGRRVLLDLYGTNHDARDWQSPEIFRPERFGQWQSNLFDFIPQGGGDVRVTHRCPGEGITVEVMKTLVRFMTQSMRYDLPRQDLRYSLSRVPSLPKSGFVMSQMRALGKREMTSAEAGGNSLSL